MISFQSIRLQKFCLNSFLVNIITSLIWPSNNTKRLIPITKFPFSNILISPSLISLRATFCYLCPSFKVRDKILDPSMTSGRITNSCNFVYITILIYGKKIFQNTVIFYCKCKEGYLNVAEVVFKAWFSVSWGT